MEEKFDYNLLSINNDISYQSKKSAIPPLGGRGAVRAKYIIFCEGFQVQHNPFFNFIPFQPAKGEQLKIYSEALKLNVIINKNIFIIPVGNNEYQVGSTYIWHDETEQVTDFGKNEILGKLNKIILCDYKIIDEKAGIRPTIIDRRPVLGAHQIHKNMFIFNGLGTKGISLAPYFSKELLLHITENKPLDKEVDIARFCNQ
jgi:glycine/D-amino acid oxidase-like deaminating enzyme